MCYFSRKSVSCRVVDSDYDLRTAISLFYERYFESVYKILVVVFQIPLVQYRADIFYGIYMAVEIDIGIFENVFAFARMCYVFYPRLLIDRAFPVDDIVFHEIEC